MLVFFVPLAASLAIGTIDGDTFRAGREVIRIVGIDAPETGERAKCAAERDLAARASIRLNDLLRARPIHVNRVGIDRFGRTLAEVRVGNMDVGETLIAEHLAVKWEGHPYRYWCSVKPERNR